MSDLINFYIIPGFVLGSVYALGAIGLTLTFGILRFANFAHGETMTLGAFFAWSLIQITGWHPLLVLPIAMVLVVIVVLAIDRGFYKPFRNSPTIMLVISSFGMMLMVRSVVQFLWGVQVKTMMPGIEKSVLFFDWLRILPRHMTIIFSALVLMLVAHYLLTYTKMGKAMRAMSDSPELAQLTGINTEGVIKATWAIGGSLAAAAGVLLAMDTQVETMMGFKLLLPVFAATILGGIGRPYGAVVGGLVIGLAEELSSYPWIGSEPLLNPGYKSGVAFAIMVAMLIWRPSGLFKGKVY